MLHAATSTTLAPHVLLLWAIGALVPLLGAGRSVLLSALLLLPLRCALPPPP